MQRIGIVTFLHNDNYGSTLQAYALQHVLRSDGYDAMHIDYQPSTVEKLKNLIMSGNSPKLLLDGLAKRSVKAQEAGAKEKSDAFRRFYREQMHLTKPCHDHDALRSVSTDFDVLLCGSDQIWSPVWFNPVYFLDFGKTQPRIAYAASLGVSQLTQKAKARHIAKLLQPFSAISVREEEGKALLNSLTGKPISVMPDPVCLLTRAEWQQLALPWHRQGYIACYFIGEREAYWQKVEALHRETGLPVVVLPVTEAAFQKQDYEIAAGLSPEAWLGVLNGAEAVVTDSFHGACFSLLLGRQVHILRRYAAGDPESKNSRIDQLLRRLSLTNTAEIDWPTVESHLEEMRNEGRKWLFSALEQAMR